MDTVTREALEASIKKWEANVAAETPKDVLITGQNCPLCKIFAGPGCYDCPVMKKTGYDECHNTPYYAAQSALVDWKMGDLSRDEWRLYAQAEVDFLKSLRPVEP